MVNGMSIGCGSDPTIKFESAAGGALKLRVWTAHVIVTVNVLVRAGTEAQLLMVTAREMLSGPPTSAGLLVFRTILVPEMLKKLQDGERIRTFAPQKVGFE